MKQNWKRQFMTVYAGQAFSVVGSAAVQFAIIRYLTVQTESAVTLTTAAIVGFLPQETTAPEVMGKALVNRPFGPEIY